MTKTGCLLALLGWLASASLAATRAEYTEASARWLALKTREKTMGTVRRMLAQPVPRPAGAKQLVYGRGEVLPVRALANLGASWLALGRAAEAKAYFDDARLLFAAASRAVLDHYDDPVPDYNGSTDQVSFALPELARAYELMVKHKQFSAQEQARARLMLLACAEFRVRKQPGGAEGNLGSRYSLGPAMVANALQADGQTEPALAAKFDAWRKRGAESFRAMMQYGWKDGAPAGRLKSMARVGNAWSRVDAPLPAAPQPGLGFSEDSSGYGSATIITLFELLEALPAAYLPELRQPATWQTIHDFIDGYRQVFLPNGAMPTYGDSTWGPGADSWVCLFELAARFFQDTARWGHSAARFRDTADRLFRYSQTTLRGLYGEDLDQAIDFMVESVTPEASVPRSCLLTRQSLAGCRVPYKLILRGDADLDHRADQPYALLAVSGGESHSHWDVGCLEAFGVGGGVLAHEAGYDAGPAFFHDQFIVRPAEEPFLPFAKVFADPAGTLLNKIDENRKRVGDITLGRDGRLPRDAAFHETKYVSWGRVGCDYTLDGGYGPRYRGKYLRHTRQAALLRASGTLVIFDTIEAQETLPELAVGPLWHAQAVLARDGQRFLCRDVAQSILEPGTAAALSLGSPARPMVVALTGPAGAVYENVPWRFLMRHGHEEVTARNHFYASARCKLAAGDCLSFLTVLTPQAPGTTSLPADPSTARVTATTGRVRVDGLQLIFGGAGQTLFGVSDGRYTATIVADGQGRTQLQEQS